MPDAKAHAYERISSKSSCWAGLLSKVSLVVEPSTPFFCQLHMSPDPIVLLVVVSGVLVCRCGLPYSPPRPPVLGRPGPAAHTLVTPPSCASCRCCVQECPHPFPPVTSGTTDLKAPDWQAPDAFTQPPYSPGPSFLAVALVPLPWDPSGDTRGFTFRRPIRVTLHPAVRKITVRQGHCAQTRPCLSKGAGRGVYSSERKPDSMLNSTSHPHPPLVQGTVGWKSIHVQ